MNSEIIKEVKNLVHHFYKDEKNSDKLFAREKQVLSQLKKGDTMSFVNKREMDVSIQKMAEKFQFHGFPHHADYLRKMYDKYMGRIPEQDVMSALANIRFLLCMSERPTDKFLEYPEEYFIKREEDEKEVINWAEYLLEGIEVYTPEELEDSSDDSEEFLSAVQSEQDLGNQSRPIIDSNSTGSLKMDFNLNRQQLMSTVQHTWYNEDDYLEKPSSSKNEANICIFWESYLNKETHGLIDLETTSVISEYKVIREILWQMFETHSSFIFHFKGNQLKVRKNVSISSIRSVAFEAFLQPFVEYIELLSFFRVFLNSLKEFEPCQTYVCYGTAIRRNILDPIYEKIMGIEEEVRKQEQSYTLLRLSEELTPIFEPLKILREIHEQITVPVQEKSALYCATSLLVNLRSILSHSVSKLEHDIKLTLYLESLYKYFFLIDSWLIRNDFVDEHWEFILHRVSSSQSIEYKTSYLLGAKITYELSGDMKEEFKSDGIMRIISTKVLQIARNIRLLFLLRKFDFYTRFQETLHHELVRRFLGELCECFGYVNTDVLEGLPEYEEEDAPKALVYKYPVISSDRCTKPTEMDDLGCLIDTNNSFLMESFADFVVETQTNAAVEPKAETLLNRISKVTTGIFNLRNRLENIFLDILKERFSVSGLMVKGALVQEHHLDQIFEFLRGLFLLCDATVFPFFEQFFSEMDLLPSTPWRYMKLSTNLKDLISDRFPSVCKKCEVSLSSDREKCSDPLEICENLQLGVSMKWPLNMVVTEKEIKVYQGLFRFILQVKWALYTLKKLSIKDFTSSQPKKPNRQVQNIIKKLEVLKFNLIHLLNFIQHYMLCFCLTKCLKQFELDFEKSNDLDTIIQSHSEFVEGFESMVQFLRDEKDTHGFKSILHCVKVLNSAWNYQESSFDVRILDRIYNLYSKCNANIRARVNKIYLINC